MRYFDSRRVGERLVPGGDGRGIDLTLNGSKDGNEWLTPQSREWFVRRFSRCAEVHMKRLRHEICPSARPYKCFHARHLRTPPEPVGPGKCRMDGVLPASLAGCCHRKRNKIQALDIPPPPILCYS